MNEEVKRGPALALPPGLAWVPLAASSARALRLLSWFHQDLGRTNKLPQSDPIPLPAL